MFIDARRVPSGEEREVGLCIIGAGAAGITLARMFTSTPHRVALLESGGFEFDARTQSLYEGRARGIPYPPLDVPRLRYFGGSTNHWGRLCAPFNEADFKRREWIPYSGWPISRQDLDPYYAQASEIFGFEPNNWSVSSWAGRGRPSPLGLGPRLAPRISRFAFSTSSRSFGDRYRDEVERASNIHAYLHANVVEIETAENARMVTRVRVRTLTGKEFSVRARHFVLAAGGIENPRLLLVSTRRLAVGLGNQHDLVGRFFTDHIRFAAGTLALADPEVNLGFYQRHRVNDAEIRGYATLTNEVKRAEELIDVSAVLDPTYDLGFEEAFDSEDVDSLRTLVRRRGGGSVGEFGESLMNVVGDLTTVRKVTIPGAPLPVPYPEVVGKMLWSRSELRARLPDLFGDIAATAYERVGGEIPLSSIAVSTRLDPAPNPDSRVTLEASRDALGMPRAQVDWQLSPIDHDSAVRTAEIVGAAFARAGLGRIKMLINENERSWPSNLEIGSHHIGTTRMSEDPRQGVVNGDCRVHGMTNLFISGSSVFPTAGSTTPTFTIVALALRLGNHLKEIMR